MKLILSVMVLAALLCVGEAVSMNTLKSNLVHKRERFIGGLVSTVVNAAKGVVGGATGAASDAVAGGGQGNPLAGLVTALLPKLKAADIAANGANAEAAVKHGQELLNMCGQGQQGAPAPQAPPQAPPVRFREEIAPVAVAALASAAAPAIGELVKGAGGVKGIADTLKGLVGAGGLGVAGCEKLSGCLTPLQQALSNPGDLGGVHDILSKCIDTAKSAAASLPVPAAAKTQ